MDRYLPCCIAPSVRLLVGNELYIFHTILRTFDFATMWLVGILCTTRTHTRLCNCKTITSLAKRIHPPPKTHVNKEGPRVRDKPHLFPVPLAVPSHGDLFFSFTREKRQVLYVASMYGFGVSSSPCWIQEIFAPRGYVCKRIFTKMWKQIACWINRSPDGEK